MSLNPRLKNAKKLIKNSDVTIVEKRDGYVEANVKGSGVVHKVVLDQHGDRCTYEWFTSYQGRRGICKHVLALTMMIL